MTKKTSDADREEKAKRLRFFPTFEALHAWFEEHHAKEQELQLGYYKRDTGKPSVTWPQSVDAALCFGWIDGVRHSISAEVYTIRFTKRKASSTWSKINCERMAVLEQEGLMREAGLRAFDARNAERTAIYAYEQRTTAELSAEEQALFQQNRAAWKFFQAQTPSYRRTSSYWVISPKRPETRVKRLQTLIADSSNGELIAQLRPRPGKK
jgi:uncharacterized protein YdeI (YjbR/CyaY-like superfamily)